MRNLLFLLLTIFISKIGFSQVLEEGINQEEVKPKTTPTLKKSGYKQHRIGLNIGGSNSMGEFSSIDPNEESSGYAEGGLFLGLSYQFSFDKNFAATFLYGSTGNRFDAQSIANQLAFQVPSSTWIVEAEAYGVGFILVGVKGQYGERSKFYVNPLIGTSAMIAPQIDISGNIGTSSVSERIRASEPSRSTMLGISFGVDLFVSDLISINLDCTYLSSEYDISQVSEVFDINGNQVFVEYVYTQPYRTLNFNVGIGFLF